MSRLFPRLFTRPRLLCTLGVSALLCGGCSENDDPVPIRAGARLGWSQVAASVAQLNGYQFVLYVDGTRSSLSNPTCDSQSTGGTYSCSGGLPALSAGQHTLELSTVENGVESGRSSPLVVAVESGTASLVVASDPTPRAVSPAAMESASVCVGAQGNDCFAHAVVVRGDAPITSLAVAGDGRLFFIEEGARVRVVEGGTVVAEPALTRERETDRFVALNVGPDFDQTQSVHLAWVEERASGDRSLTVARYREVRGKLAQGQVIVTGLTLPATGDPQVAWDSAGRIYVAVPAPPDGAASRRDAYSGQVLRFSPDGTIPWQTGQVSPVLAAGLALPMATASDDTAGRLWLAGQRGDGEADLGWLTWESPDTRVPRMFSAGSGGSRTEGGTALVSMAIVRPDDSRPLGRMFLVDADGRLSSAELTNEGLSRRRDAVAFNLGTPLGVAAGLQRDVYVVVRTDGDSPSPFAVVRLRPNSR